MENTPSLSAAPHALHADRVPSSKSQSATQNSPGPAYDATGALTLPWRISKRHILVPLLVMSLAVALIPNARQNWEWVYGCLRALPGLDEFFSTTRQYAETTSVITLAIVIWMLDRKNRKTIFPFLLALGVASLVVGAAKNVAARARPTYGLHIDNEERKWVRDYRVESPNPIMDTARADYWLWFSDHRPIFNDRYSSFPSGHAATAFTIALYLSLLYGRPRVLFYLLAIGCAMARIRYRRHYPEDVLFGAGFGSLVAVIVFSRPTVARWGVRMVALVENCTARFGDERTVGDNVSR